MLYIKRQCNGVELKVLLEPEVYTICPGCGRELKLDLQELFQENAEFDLCNSNVFCQDCGKDVVITQHK